MATDSAPSPYETSSANLPSLVMLLFWKGVTRQGIIAAIIVGMTSSLAWILLSADTFTKVYGLSADQVDEIKAAMAKLGLPAGVYTALQEKKDKAPKGKDLFKTVVYAIREDGVYIEAGENDNLIVQKLDANPNAVGIFGFSFLEENGDKVHGSEVDGVVPSFDSISSGDYPISRPLYFYIKRAHVGKIPGIQEYAREFTSEKAMGEDGYLLDRGLIPLGEDELKKIEADVKALTPLTM